MEELSLNPFADFLIQPIEKKEPIRDLFEEKYKPTNLQNFVGQKGPIRQLQQWLNNPGERLLTIIHGPTGVGKSLLTRLILEKWNIIEPPTQNKSELFNQIKKIFLSQSIDFSLFQSKPSAIIIESIDKNIGEGVYYKKFIDLLKSLPKGTPVICITSGATLKKKYNTPSFINIIKLDFPETNDLQKYCKRIQDSERISLTDEAINTIISSSNYDFRKILHYFKLLTLKKKNKFNKKDIETVQNFSETDVFMGAYEIIDDTLNNTIDNNIENVINTCYNDQPLIVDLLYSNTAHLKDIKPIEEIINSMSLGDVFQYYTYKYHSWEMREYSVTHSCAIPITVINKHKKKEKLYKIKKNQLNNLPWNCVKNKNILLQVKRGIKNWDNQDILYAFKNIICPTIDRKIGGNELTTYDVSNLHEMGIDLDLYTKMRRLTILDKPKQLTKKMKNILEGKFKELE